MRKMRYKEALEVLTGMSKFGINLGMGRIKSLLEQLGNPQESLKFIHIGGTNGKGSTAAMLTSILREAGYKVGLYTSPHLVSYTERITVNLQPIPETQFAGIMAEIVSVYNQVHRETGDSPTEFEALTALALLYFARSGADVVVLEVGLGGDLDSTNIITSSLVTIITNVSIDHTNYLGENARLIAEKKSGIIKQGCPVITASTDEDVLEVLQSRAMTLMAPFYQIREEVSGESVDESLQGQLFRLRTGKVDYGVLRIPLLGEHQISNAALAVFAAQILQEKGWHISKEQIRSGLAGTRWPGRLEAVSRDPLVILDGAHNAAGMEALGKWLRKSRSKYKKVILVIGMLDDKERERSIEFIKPLVNQVIVTRPHSIRTEKWQLLADVFRDGGCTVSVVEDIQGALSKGLSASCPGDMLLVTGSLYLIGDVREILLSGS